MLFRSIAVHWRWICTGEGQPGHLSTLPARQAALDASLDTIVQIVRDRRGFTEELTKQAHDVIALRWHADPETELAIVRAASITHEFRARIRAAACPAPVEAPTRSAD